MLSLRVCRLSVLSLGLILFAAPLLAQTPAGRQYLHGTWRMQSSCQDSAKGEQIS